MLCMHVHDQLYVRRNPERAARRAVSLAANLARRASDEHAEDAIVYWEARALIAELRGELAEAVRCRRREIEQLERLHQCVRDGEAPRSVLKPGARWRGRPRVYGRGADVLEVRRSILRELLRRADEE